MQNVKSVKKKRPCLRCDKLIYTEPHWRLCTKCREFANSVELFDYHIGDQAGRIRRKKGAA